MQGATAERVPYVGKERGSNPYDPMRDQALWGAVIVQASRDAVTDHYSADSGTPVREAQDAIKWLLYPSREMASICRLAGADPIRVRREAIRTLLPLAKVFEAKAATAGKKAAVRYRETIKLIRDGAAE